MAFPAKAARISRFPNAVSVKLHQTIELDRAWNYLNGHPTCGSRDGQKAHDVEVKSICRQSMESLSASGVVS